METAELIRHLAADASIVRRLHRPWLRAMLWLAIALPYVALIVHGKLMVDTSRAVADPRFMIEQAATFATAPTAAFAASAALFPVSTDGRSCCRWVRSPCGLAALARDALQDWLQFGADGLGVRPDWDCLPSARVMGIIPAIAMVVMLHLGNVAILFALAGWIAKYVLGWPHAKAAR